MKVKRSSWHYRISNFGNDFENKHDNLCRYFWRIVIKLVLACFITNVFIMFIYFYFSDLQFVSNTILILFLISIVIVPILAIHYIRKIKGEPVELPYENILYEYMKAKKRKVCPLIEYVD